MSDVTSTETVAPTPTTTPPVLPNEPGARTPSGELKDQSSAQPGPPAKVEPPPPPAIPDSYTFKSPDGFALDDALVKDVTPLLREMGLSQDNAQKLVDWYGKNVLATQDRAAKAVESMRTEWRSEVAKDPEIGSKLDTVKANIGRALTSLNDPKLVDDFKAAMDLTGAGDHPAVIRAINKWAAMVNEGQHVSGSGPSPLGQVRNGQAREPTAAQALYPTLPTSQR